MGYPQIGNFPVQKRPLGFPLQLPRSQFFSSHLFAARGAVSDAARTFAGFAKGDRKGASLAYALTGKEISQLSAEQKKALFELRERIIGGSLDPEVETAPEVSQLRPGKGADDQLPLGTKGVFISSKTGYGTILLSENLLDKGAEATRPVALEEFGEAMADAAKKAGLPVADGDAGARLVRVLNGETTLPESAFASAADDTATVVHDGAKVEAQAFRSTFVNALVSQRYRNFEVIDMVYGNHTSSKYTRTGLDIGALNGTLKRKSYEVTNPAGNRARINVYWKSDIEFDRYVNAPIKTVFIKNDNENYDHQF
ncbi:MAG: hypothetical protein AAF362_07590, partial [Pseudomonadota bacterium]